MLWSCSTLPVSFSELNAFAGCSFCLEMISCSFFIWKTSAEAQLPPDLCWPQPFCTDVEQHLERSLFTQIVKLQMLGFFIVHRSVEAVVATTCDRSSVWVSSPTCTCDWAFYRSPLCRRFILWDAKKTLKF